MASHAGHDTHDHLDSEHHHCIHDMPATSAGHMICVARRTMGARSVVAVLCTTAGFAARALRDRSLKSSLHKGTLKETLTRNLTGKLKGEFEDDPTRF